MSELAARILARCEPEGECLVWQGATNSDGYGVIRLPGSQRLAYVHRAIYGELVGPIPDGLTIDHVAARGCLFRACCNSDHLEAVTQIENLRRGKTSTLTLAQVKEIRRSTGSIREVGRRYGVNGSTISRIRTGQAWAEAA